MVRGKRRLTTSSGVKVFVDLFRVVRQTMRTSHDGYSLKQIRTFFMKGAGEGAVTGGGQSIVEFARWLESRDGTILKAIERYNEEDCHSTLQPGMAARAQTRSRAAISEGDSLVASAGRSAAEPIKKPVDVHADVRGRLLQTVTGEAGDDSAHLFSNLLDYHRREAKPAWWAYYHRLTESPEELRQNTEAIGGLSPRESAAGRKSSPPSTRFLS